MSTTIRSLCIRLAPAIVIICLLVGIAIGGEADPYASYRDGLARCDSLHHAGRYEACVAAARTLLARAEAAEGPSSLIAAEIIDRIVSALTIGGKGATAYCREMAVRELAIKERLLPADSSSLAETLDLVGLVHEQAGDYAGARELKERALAIREKTLDPADPKLAESLVSVANLRARLGDYAGLAGLYERALAICETAFGPDHDKVAMTLQNFAIFRKLTGDYQGAEQLYRRVLTIYEHLFGPAHLRLARVHHNLGNLHFKTGDYQSARRDYEKALAIREAALGPDNLQVGRTLTGLAETLTQIGELVEAWDCAQRALDIYLTTLGPEHDETAITQSILAHVLLYLGDTRRAEALITEALPVQEAALGPDHPRVAEFYLLLGRILARAGDLERAEDSCRRALAIHESMSEPLPRELADDLLVLGRILVARGQIVDGRAFLRRSVALCEEALGASNPELVVHLLVLGNASLHAGDAEEAVHLLERAREMATATMGEQHPHHARCLRLLGGAYLATGAQDRALETALAAEHIGCRDLRLLARGLPEQLALLYAPGRTRGLDLALSILDVTASSPNPQQIRDVWDAVVRSRALILDEMAARQRVLVTSGDEETEALQQERADVVRELAWLHVAGFDGTEPADLGARMRRLQDRQEMIERELARRSGPAVKAGGPGDVGLADVIATLPERCALVSFVRFASQATADLREPAPGGADTSRTSYAAFVLPSRQADPLFVPLGSAAVIDLAVSRWRDEAGHGIGIPGRSAGTAEQACRAAGDRLRRLVWGPVAPRLQAADRVVIVPDGKLHLVDFAALPAVEGRYLVETDPLLSHVVSERDLAAPAPRDLAAGGLLALGDPDFDVQDRSPAMAATPSTPRGETGLRAPECDEFRRIHFNSLPESAFEVEEIARIWENATSSESGPGSEDREVLLLQGGEASEDAFKRLAGGYRILHLATHGFFLDASCRPDDGTRGIGGLRPMHAAANTATGVTNPLLMSGFALAGANARQSAGPDQEDGIVLAGEIAALELNGVSLAVLSACETGLGTVLTDEGVLGLQRAFHVAGVRTLVTSLWNVADETARLWMTAFYRERLQGASATDAAARQASRDLLAVRRAAGQSTHPHYWAGFIATGPIH